MPQTRVHERIIQYNKGRDAAGLLLKYREMQRDSFRFFRATAHLFVQDWPKNSILNSAPLAWVCGDLHLENFGSYKGDNRLSYFDINDFDESALAPCTLDLARFLCSLRLAADTIDLSARQVAQLSEMYLSRYYHALADGKARWIERAISTGMIRDLLRHIKHCSRADLIDKYTHKVAGQRVLRTEEPKVVALSADKKHQIRALMANFAAQQADPAFFKVLDVAQRFAGLSSLGLERYIILVAGHGAKHRYLLDMKHQLVLYIQELMAVQIQLYMLKNQVQVILDG
jgi:uncharacterized protein (DUF2252 family)